MEYTKYLQAVNNNSKELDLRMTELVLTPLTCSSLISEMLKCLIYEKLQIPYPYSWLKSIIDRKKSRGSEIETEKVNLTAERQYTVASTAFETVEMMLRNIRTQFLQGDNIREVVFLFGASYMNPKELYRVTIPELNNQHKKECNYTSSKYQQAVLRQIFLSEEWMGKVEKNLPVTNMYLFIKTNNIENQDYFVPCEFNISKNTRSFTVNLMNSKLYHNCCGDLLVFQDGSETPNPKQKCIISDDDDKAGWFRATTMLKGFKEKYINQVAVSELW